MSDLNLRFTPWLRRGLVRKLVPQTAGASASIAVNITVGGQVADQTLRLRGPGDVVGIEPSQIIRLDPEPGTVDFEPNYFPAVEFSTPDLPWMFTPAVPDADDHLLPWLTLVTVGESAVAITMRAGAQLPVLTVPLAELLPDLNEMWAWAHVQSTELYKPAQLTAALEETPEAFISRILSPRNLQPDTAYIACLVPTFEAGRRAGLGLTVTDDVGNDLSWSLGDTGDIDLPVYYSWSFRTSRAGDFETLVTRLQPRELNATVGRRDMDLRHMGIPLPKGVRDTTYFFGALVSPTAMASGGSPRMPTIPRSEPDLPDISLPGIVDPLRQALYTFLTSEASEPDAQAYDYRVDDPVVTPPIYGREQLKGAPLPAPASERGSRPKPEEPVYYSVVNTLVRARGAAGLGVRVVREHQEAFMARAWSEVAALRSINQTLQQATYASLVANRWQSRVASLEEGDTLQLTRSAHARILPASGSTVWAQVRAATLPSGVISTGFQRIVRSGGVVHHAMQLATGTPIVQRSIRQIAVAQPTRLVALLEHALPKGTGISGNVSSAEPDSLNHWYTRPFSGAVMQIEKQFQTVLPDGVTAAERTAVTDAVLKANRLAAAHIAYLEAAGKDGTLPPAIQSTRGAAAQQVRATNAYINQVSGGSEPDIAQITAIRNQTRQLQTALNNWIESGEIIVHKPEIPVEPATNTLVPIVNALKTALVPTQTISAHLKSRITLNGKPWGNRAIPSRFTAAPVFEDALYRYVCELSPEYMLPGIGDIPHNTVGLVEVNGEFVEAVLFGANLELSREMRWREYPADLSGTWFKRFWNAAHDDIRAIDENEWLGSKTLGENLIGQLADDSLVLLIKGEVLRRYPNLAVYALEAEVTTVQVGKQRIPVRVARKPEQPLYPAFSGRLDTGVRFFGFDLKRDAALGTATPQNTSGSAGYFFALQEQPTEPRFGLNEYEEGESYTAPANWSELSWGHFISNGNPDSPAYLPIGGAFNRLALPDSTAADAATSVWGSHAGAMARIVLQRPVRMLVHASAMLP